MRRALPLLLPAFALLAACERAREDVIAPAAPHPIQGSRAAAAPIPPIKITALYPQDATVGVEFRREFDGCSGLGIAGSGFTPTSRVIFDGVLVASTCGSHEGIVARIPPYLLANVRKVEVIVRDRRPARRESPPAHFDIVPPRPPGSCGRIGALYPSATRAGAPFGAIPDGSSSLGIAGRDFVPGTRASFGGVLLETTYLGPSSLVAQVPRNLLVRSRKVSITLKDPGCAMSAAKAANFKIEP